ncbi:MAG: SDR family oxidoreductase [Candidatus Binatia bacterium]
MSSPLILLTGATGYIGGRLLQRLEEKNYQVRCLARRPEFLATRVGPKTEIVAGDVLAAETLGPALAGVSEAFYLVHSMGLGASFEQNDRMAAQNFALAARKAGVQRIIYLGGLGSGEGLSPHLQSRQQVGEVLRAGNVPVIEFRASIVIGSGSLSFEMIRALVERLPVMVTPRWVSVPTQPIAVKDVLDYLMAAVELPTTEHRVFEIGGTDRVSYRDIMFEYARQRGLRRLMIPVPVISPRLSSLWLGLVTPLYARVGRKLIDSIRNPTVVNDDTALRAFGRIQPMGLKEAIRLALRNEDQEFAETRWSDAVSAGGATPTWGGERFGNRRVDARSIVVDASCDRLFAVIERIGGRNGWYGLDWLWQLRGWLDLIFGGIGLRRGRRNPDQLRVGDALDFWRVEALERDRFLRLCAEMKLPGRAWLEFSLEPMGGGSQTRITQTAIFDPVGLGGLAYWYGVYPLHRIVFGGMIQAIGREAGRPRSK